MSCRVTEPVHFQRTVGVQCCQLDQFADDCCPFSVLVRGGWKDYRNSDAFKKAEVECVPLRFHGCFSHTTLVDVAGKPLCMFHLCVRLCLWFYQALLVDIRSKKETKRKLKDK